MCLPSKESTKTTWPNSSPKQVVQRSVCFAFDVLFSQRTEFTKFVSEQIATAHSRHTSRRRRIPMPASSRRRAHCNRYEARVRIVALISCCLVRLSNGGLDFLVTLSHCQRVRSEVFALVPLQRAASTRWLSVVISEAAAKRCFSLCLTCQFLMRPRDLVHG